MPTDQTVHVKILPENNAGAMPIGSATALSLTTRSRYARPYPPANLRMQGAAYGTRFTRTIGDLVVTWSSRNRLTQIAAAKFTLQDAADVAGESGQTFTAKVYVGGVLKHTTVVITTPESYTYTALQRVADSTDGTLAVQVQIFSNANSLDSFFANTHTPVTMTGFGFGFGNSFGGMQA
jgi:hypothetical protein